MRNMHKLWHDSAPDFKYHVEDLMGEGDKVAALNLCQPVLASESLDAIELAKIARHHGQPATTSVTSDQ